MRLGNRFPNLLAMGLLLAASVAGGAALSRYMERANSAFEDRIELYNGLGRCISMHDASPDIQYHCEELWERYNRLASGMRD